MSDDIRFDGKNIYAAGVAGAAIYNIRGNHIHEAGIASQPKYEIRGNHIRLYMSASQPKFKPPASRSVRREQTRTVKLCYNQ